MGKTLRRSSQCSLLAKLNDLAVLLVKSSEIVKTKCVFEISVKNYVDLDRFHRVAFFSRKSALVPLRAASKKNFTRRMAFAIG